MPAATEFLSFPPETLGREPLRLPVLERGAGWIVLSKPAGVPWCPDPWIPRPTDLVREVRRLIREGKPQLARLGMTDFFAVAGPDLIASGAVLCATTAAEATRLANALGSQQIELVHHLVTTGRPADATIECHLPLAPHATEPRMTASPAEGKKTTTRFECLERFRGWTVWRAATRFCRPHQIRVHASESGLPIVGEARYAKIPPVFLSEIKRDYRTAARPERPLYGELCLHLAAITFPDCDGQSRTVTCPPPKGLAVLLRRLAEHAAG